MSMGSEYFSTPLLIAAVAHIEPGRISNMLKSCMARLAGLGAIAGLAIAATAGPAGAFAVRTCASTGPQISEVTTYGWVGARWLPSYSISGTCFGASPEVEFDSANPWFGISNAFPPVSSTGTISTPVDFGTLSAGQTETVTANYCGVVVVDDCYDEHGSNTITFTVP
jgi:hypothetical protein